MYSRFKAYKIILQSYQIYFLGSVKPELKSKHIPTPTSFLENGRGGPDTYLTDSAGPWKFHGVIISFSTLHLQVTNLPYFFISSSNSLHEHWLGKTTDCWLGVG